MRRHRKVSASGEAIIHALFSNPEHPSTQNFVTGQPICADCRTSFGKRQVEHLFALYAKEAHVRPK
jgi:hypothetical protein